MLEIIIYIVLMNIWGYLTFKKYDLKCFFLYTFVSLFILAYVKYFNISEDRILRSMRENRIEHMFT
jgi:hypothetical protein